MRKRETTSFGMGYLLGLDAAFALGPAAENSAQEIGMIALRTMRKGGRA